MGIQHSVSTPDLIKSDSNIMQKKQALFSIYFLQIDRKAKDPKHNSEGFGLGGLRINILNMVTKQNYI